MLPLCVASRGEWVCKEIDGNMLGGNNEGGRWSDPWQR
jgi:hypothetical protein